MARRRKLTEEQAEELFRMCRSGFSNDEIARRFGIAKGTVATYYRRVLAERSNHGNPRMVATRGVGQFLTCSVEYGYVGHTLVGGVEETEAFDSKSDEDAIVRFDKWLELMTEEDEALREQAAHDDVDELVAAEHEAMVQMRAEPVAEQAVVEQAVAEEAVAEPEAMPVARPQVDEAGDGRPDTSYVIVVVKPKLSVFGLYDSLETAIEETDRLNDVAMTLGIEDAFQTFEASWK